MSAAMNDESREPTPLEREADQVSSFDFTSVLPVRDRGQYCPGCGARLCWCGISSI
jgi:hypothetical protein